MLWIFLRATVRATRRAAFSKICLQRAIKTRSLMVHSLLHYFLSTSRHDDENTLKTSSALFFRYLARGNNIRRDLLSLQVTFRHS